MITVREALETVSRSPWTALVLSAEGEIEEVVPVAGNLTSEGLLEFTRKRARGRRFRLVQQADLSEAQLTAMISQATEPHENRGSDRRALDATVSDAKLRLHPFAPARAIADAIVDWLMRR